MSLFVFGNGFQVSIVGYVTWWLMGKSHLPLMRTSESQPCMPSRVNAQQVEGVPSPDNMTHLQLDARFLGVFFFEAVGHAFTERGRSLWRQGAICAVMTVQPPKGRLRLYGGRSGVLPFIGHVAPWGRTNWWPQRAPCFVHGAHKDIMVACV